MGRECSIAILCEGAEEWRVAEAGRGKLARKPKRPLGITQNCIDGRIMTGSLKIRTTTFSQLFAKQEDMVHLLALTAKRLSGSDA